MIKRNLLKALAAAGVALACQTASAAPDLMKIPLQDIHGRTGALGAWEGKVLLIVNVASECGYTPQYKGLEELYQSYKSRGLVVLGFPSNDFGNQEPDNEQQIYAFCTKKYQVTFPLFSKINLRVNAHPLFTALTSPASPIPGPITWNFNKFLIGRDGVLKARFGPDTEPDSMSLKNAIEKELGPKPKD